MRVKSYHVPELNAELSFLLVELHKARVVQDLPAAVVRATIGAPQQEFGLGFTAVRNKSMWVQKWLSNEHAAMKTVMPAVNKVEAWR